MSDPLGGYLGQGSGDDPLAKYSSDITPEPPPLLRRPDDISYSLPPQEPVAESGASFMGRAIDKAAELSLDPITKLALSNPLVKALFTTPTKAVEALTHPKELISAARNVFNRKGELVGTIGGGLKTGVKALGQSLTNPYPNFSPEQIQTGTFLWENILAPFAIRPAEAAFSRNLDPLSGQPIGSSKSPEEALRAGEEAVGNYGAVLVGNAVGRAITRAGKATDAIKVLSGVNSLDQLPTRLPYLDATKQFEIASELTKINTGTKFIQGVTEGSTGGAFLGLATGKTPQEQWENAFNYALAGSILGGLGEAAAAKNTSGLSADALRLATEKQRQIIMSLPPKNAARAAAQLMDGLPIDQIMMRQIPEGEIGVLQGVQKLSGNMRDRPNVITHKNPEGGFDLLISNDKGKGVPNPNVYLEYTNPENKLDYLPVKDLKSPDVTEAIDAVPSNISRDWDKLSYEDRTKALNLAGDIDPLYVDELARKGTEQLDPAELRLLNEVEKELNSATDNANLVYKDDRGNVLGRANIEYRINDPLHKATKFEFVNNVEDLGHGSREIPISDEIKTQLFDEAQRLGYDPLNLIKPKTQYEAIAQEALKGPIEGFEEKFLANINKLESDLAHQELALSQRPNDPALIEDINILQKRLEFANEQLARERQRVAKNKENAFNSRMLDRYSPSNLTKEDIVSFAKDGYVENQVVFHNGKTYSFQESLGKNQLSLQDINTGELIIANRKEVFSTPRIEKAYRSADGTVIWEGPTGDVRRAPKNLDDLYGENTLSLAEAEIVNENIDKEVKASRNLGEDLARRISSSGHIIEPKGDGTYNVLNRQTGELIKNISSIDELKELSPNLGDGFDIGDGGGGVTIRPPSKNPEDWGPSPSENHAENNAAGAFLDNFRTATKYFQSTHQVFKAIENKFKEAQVYTHGFLPLSRSLLRYYANLKEPLERVQKMYNSVIKDKIKQDRMSVIYGHLESISSPEIEQGDLIGRALNKNELLFSDTHAQALGDPLSLKHAQDYLLQRAILKSNGVDGIKLEEALKRWEAAKGELTLAQRNFVDDLTENQSQDFRNFSTYGVISNIDAKLNKSVTQAEYAKAKNMTPQELLVSQLIAKEFKDLAPTFGISDSRRISRYVSHRLKYENDLDINVSSIYPHLSASEKEFFASLPRMGYMTELNRDPFEMLVRYIVSGNRAIHLSQTVDRVRATFTDAIDKIVNDAETKTNLLPHERKALGEGYKLYFDRYLQEALGGVDRTEILVAESARRYLKKLTKSDDSKVGAYINAIISDFNPFEPRTLVKNVEFAAQGFKFLAGIRDAVTIAENITSLFGPEVTADIMSDLGRLNREGTLLKEMGVTPGLSIDMTEISNQSLANRALELAGGDRIAQGYIYKTLRAGARAFDNARDLGFKLSLQPLVYEKMHAGVYMAIKRRTLKNMKELVEGRMTRANFEKKIDLDIYQPAVIREFNNLLSNYKYEQAASLLGEESGYLAVGHYGMGNSPQFMWNKYGRLFGQFGTWGINQLNTLADIAARGKATNKAKRLAYVLGSWALMNQIQDETGLNLKTWTLDPRNTFFRPGPVASLLDNVGRGLASYNQGDRDYAMWQIKSLVNPKTGIFIPIPLMFRANALDAIERYQQGDPTPVALWRLIGGSLDREQYPNPLR